MFSTYDIYIEHFFSMAHLELISDVKVSKMQVWERLGFELSGSFWA